MTPFAAFYCTDGYRGALCATCNTGYYFRAKKCHRCKDELLSPGAIAALTAISILATCVVLYPLIARRYAKDMKRVLHRMRRKVRAALGIAKTRRRRRRRMQRYSRKRVRLKKRGRRPSARVDA